MQLGIMKRFAFTIGNATQQCLDYSDELEVTARSQTQGIRKQRPCWYLDKCVLHLYNATRTTTQICSCCQVMSRFWTRYFKNICKQERQVRKEIVDRPILPECLPISNGLQSLSGLQFTQTRRGCLESWKIVSLNKPQTCYSRKSAVHLKKLFPCHYQNIFKRLVSSRQLTAAKWIGRLQAKSSRPSIKSYFNFISTLTITYTIQLVFKFCLSSCPGMLHPDA